MSSTFIRAAILWAVFIFGGMGDSISHATLLKLAPGGGFRADISTVFMTATYHADLDTLSIVGVPVSIDYDQTAPQDSAIGSGGPGNPASYAIQVLVDGAGALVGKGTATDLSIMGLIYSGPHTSPVYGLLLSGRATSFGYSNSSPNRLFEFVFQVNGGSQAAQFGPSVGVIFDTIAGFNGSFAGDFSTSFAGNADSFAIPEPSTSWLLTIGSTLLFGACVGRRVRLKASGTAPWRMAKLNCNTWLHTR